MAKTKPKRPAGADLSTLSQQRAAWLLEKSPVWLRDHADEVPRRSDGKYNARELVRWAADEPAELDDNELERVRTMIEMLSYASDFPAQAVVTVSEEIVRKHGLRGLSAIGDALLEFAREDLEVYDPPEPEKERLARKMRELEQEERERIDRDTALDELKITTVCYVCGRVRCGRRWEKGRVPGDHERRDIVCPSCSEEGRG